MRIGITMNYRLLPDGREQGYLDREYLDFLLEFGAAPVPLMPTPDLRVLGELLDSVGGLVLTGGMDIDPARYGQSPHPQTGTLHPRREASEFIIYQEARRRKLPILAICLGIQTVNVAHGGSLHQHLPDLPGTVGHRKEDSPQQGYDNFHELRVAPGSLLHQIVQHEQVKVNSFHHQGVAQVAPGLKPTAWTTDGLVEALEDPEYPAFFLAVQWHPERDMANPVNRNLIDLFLGRVGKK